MGLATVDTRAIIDRFEDIFDRKPKCVVMNGSIGSRRASLSKGE